MRKPIKLTQTIVNSFKLAAGKDDDTISDRDAPGLKLRIRREGARVFLFQRRFAGQNPKILIGSAASWTLEAARRKAREMATFRDNSGNIFELVVRPETTGWRYFPAREIVELAMVVGFYVSTAIFVKALAVPAEKA